MKPGCNALAFQDVAWRRWLVGVSEVTVIASLTVVFKGSRYRHTTHRNLVARLHLRYASKTNGGVWDLP
jgi:hypothetical protein